MLLHGLRMHLMCAITSYVYCVIFNPTFGCHIQIKRIVLHCNPSWSQTPRLTTAKLLFLFESSCISDTVRRRKRRKATLPTWRPATGSKASGAPRTSCPSASGVARAPARPGRILHAAQRRPAINVHYSCMHMHE